MAITSPLPLLLLNAFYFIFLPPTVPHSTRRERKEKKIKSLNVCVLSNVSYVLAVCSVQPSIHPPTHSYIYRG